MLSREPRQAVISKDGAFMYANSELPDTSLQNSKKVDQKGPKNEFLRGKHAIWKLWSYFFVKGAQNFGAEPEMQSRVVAFSALVIPKIVNAATQQ